MPVQPVLEDLSVVSKLFKLILVDDNNKMPPQRIIEEEYNFANSLAATYIVSVAAASLAELGKYTFISKYYLHTPKL